MGQALLLPLLLLSLLEARLQDPAKVNCDKNGIVTVSSKMESSLKNKHESSLKKKHNAFALHGVCVVATSKVILITKKERLPIDKVATLLN
jgi:hypothetical protein